MSCYSGTLTADLNPTTKLRYLKLKERNKLSAILQINNSWQQLAGVIRDPDNVDAFLYTADDINILDSQRKFGRNPAEALLEHWSTCGQNQPDLSSLLKYLKNSNLLRAVHYVETELLKFSNSINEDDFTSEELEAIKDEQKNNIESAVNYIEEKLQEINLSGLTVFPFEKLSEATMRFCDLRVEKGGYKIGEGTFGAVFRAHISNKIVAVKKLKDDVDKQFFTELNILVRYKHENLLPLLGCSFNGPSCCLIYEYMENGSLQERLACRENTPPLTSEVRIAIAFGSALGINHLHTFEEKPMVHRDIKSANILLDVNFVPKVGDFGLVRIGDSNMSSTVAVTGNVVGTCVYMAREAFNGDVSVKLDSFSFGVVLLELLTGLPPYDVNREDRDLITFMENCDDISTMLDQKATWNVEGAVELYKIASFCLTGAKRKRPAIAEILKDLQKCCLSYNNTTR